MPICLDLLLAADRYDAGGGQNPRETEWPPNPARVSSALRSVAQGEDLPALRVLESLPPPVIHATSTVWESRTRTYVVTNQRDAKGGNLNHPGRTSGLRERRSIFPQSPRVQMIWMADEEVSDDTVSRLDAIARRVPYLGRSTSIVLMGVQRVTDPSPPAGLHILEPITESTGDLQLRVPYDGYTAELDALFDAGLSAWQASDGARARQAYRWRDPSKPSEPSAAPRFESSYRDLVVLRLQDRRPEGRLTPILTAALRSMVMSHTGDPLPPALHGHGVDGKPHVAYLGLPVCGHEHADGHLVALAVAIPGMDETERRRILRGILGPEGDATVSLRVPGIRDNFTLRYQPTTSLPKSATASHWTRASRHWVTATPIVLDRYPKDGNIAAGVLESVTLAGLPEPETVEVSQAPMTPGAVQLTPRELPRRARGRLYSHARISFSEPIAGPVLAGAGRYFGVGLFLPEENERSEGSARQ